MSDPEVIKAITNNFIPLLIINNKHGKDRTTLKKFNEPAWNYQVIRFLTAEGKDIIPRKDKVNTKAALLKRMNLALAAK